MPPGAALLFFDQTILRLFPPLRAAWAARGQQAVVPVTGHNARRVLSGTVNVRTGRRTLWRHRTMGQAGFHDALRDLWRRYRGRPIWLVLDCAGCQTAKASRALAADLGVTLVWLPRQTPKLNGMDHLWRGLKADVSANRQYDTIDEHADQAERWLLSLTNAEALHKAGILSPRFWLRRVRTNFWPRT